MLGAVSADVVQYHEQQKEISKYANMDAYDKDVRKAVLKDKNLNPFLIQDPVDATHNVLHRWKEMASSPQVAKMTPEQKAAASLNYYKAMVVPQYQRMGAKAPSEEDWQKNAYGRALDYNIDDMYDNNWSRGYYEGFKQYENGIRTGMTYMGGMIKDAIDLTSGWLTSEGKPWKLAEINQKAADIRADISKKGPYQHFKETTDGIPILGGTMRSLDRQISSDSFWHDIQPNHHWGDGVTSNIAEQTMMLPIYFASGGFSEGLITELGTGETLTAKVMSHPIGKIVGSLLTNGAEGAAYGYTMANQEDKKDWWQAAISQAVIGTVLHLGAEGAGAVFKGLTESSKAKKATADALRKGVKIASTDDLRENMVKTMGGIMAAGGRPAASDYVRDAMRFVYNTAHLAMHTDEDYYAQAVQNAIKEDPLRNKGVTTIATYIKKYLEEFYDGKVIRDLSQDEAKDLENHILSLIEEGGERAPEVVEAVAQKAGADAVKSTQNGKNPGGKEIIDQWTQEELEKDKEAGLPPNPERAKKMAEARYAEANAKAAKKAAKEKAAKPVKEATEVQSRKTSSKYPTDTPIGIRVSKPKYGYDGKNFELDFEDPEDKAAYILSNRGKSAAHDAISEWYSRGGSERLAEHGQRVRDFLKRAAEKGNPEDGPIRVPKIGHKAEIKTPKVKTSAPKTSASERVSPTVTFRTRSRVSKTGERSVSFSAEHSWIVYAKKQVGSLKSKDLMKWLYDMIDNDPRAFSKDLEDHFYPKDLKDHEVWFESQYVKNLGKEDPNFLAFMYNYTDKMPKEFAEALSYALEETAKFEKSFKIPIATDLQKNKYAMNTWNHVAEMIHHPKFVKEGERNIFRSSFPKMDKPSKWQGPKTLAETEDQERDWIKGMFKGKPEAGKAASVAYEAAASLRRKAIKEGDPAARKAANLAIDDVLVSTGERERMDF